MIVEKLEADPGFPVGPAANPPGEPTYDLPNFLKETAKNREHIGPLREGWGHVPVAPPYIDTRNSFIFYPKKPVLFISLDIFCEIRSGTRYISDIFDLFSD